MTIADAATLSRARDRSRAAWPAWHASPAMGTLRDAFVGIAAGDIDTLAERAAAVLIEAAWMSPLLAPLIAGLADDPWFEPPLRVARDTARIGAVLFEDDRVLVAASVLDALETPPDRIVATGRMTVTRFERSSGARLRCWTIDGSGALIPSHDIPLADGMVLRLDGRREAHALIGATGPVATLSIIVRATDTPVAREFTADGTRRRTAEHDENASRTRMLLTMLRVAGRTDAAIVFDAATRHPAPSLRWHAMREWLALDAGRAAPRLGEMAQSDRDTAVRAAAVATLPMVEERRRCHA